MPRLFHLILVLLCSAHVIASVPEPSFVLFGIVESSGTQVRQQGMVISAAVGNDIVADIELDNSNQFQYSLEIQLEAAIGARSVGKARVGDIIDLRVSGQNVANVLITDRGVSKRFNLPLPAGFDADGDGILDSDEVASGQDPNNPNDPVAFGNLDIDGDGISNGREFLTGTYDPNGDYDGDGFSNTDEYSLNKNPANAEEFPDQYAEFGQYSPLNTHVDAVSSLLASDGSVLVWDEQVNGVPVSMVAAMWNIDSRYDLIVSTDQGKLFVLTQGENQQLSAPQLLSLFSVPAEGDLFVGFSDFDAVNSAELWAFSRSNNRLFVFKRSPTGQPHGQELWFSLALDGITGAVDVSDLDQDGIPDVIASGVDLGIVNRTQSNTIAFYKGRWDGVNYSLSSPVLLASEAHVNNSSFQIIPNVNEAGFDNKVDVLLRGNDQRFYINLSFNGLKRAEISQSLIQTLSAIKSPGISSSVTRQLAELNTASAADAFLMASLTDDEHSDLLQYHGASKEFRIIPGFHSIRDSDNDGIPDYRDLAMNNKDLPLPSGDVDFDGDGIPYAIDGNHSGQEDADGDGMPDSFELTHGLNPKDDSDRDSDLDGDGIHALQEFLDGTDPSDSASFASDKARLIASSSVFDQGASDLLVVDNDVVVASMNSSSVKILNSQDLSDTRTLEIIGKNGASKLLYVQNQLVVGTVDGSVDVWDYGSSRKLITFDRSDATVTDMAAQGSSLFTLHADGYIYHWDLQRLVYVNHWRLYDGVLTSIFAKGDFLYVQSSSPEKIMFVWDVVNNQNIYNITGQADCCEQVVAEASGNKLLLANSFSGKGIYSLDTSNFTADQVVPDIDASAIKAVSSEIYVGRKSGVIDWYSASDGEFIGRVAAPNQHVRKIELTDGGFISLHSDGKVYFWEHN